MENNDLQEKKSFKERVLQEIEANDVKAYSRAHFTFRVILLVVVTVLTLVVSVFLFNFVFFSLRISGRGSLLGFGSTGFLFFIRVFPWPLLVFDIVLVAILEWLLRKFRFGYRSPVLYLLLVLLAVTISIGFFIDRGTGLNDALLHQADEHHLPGLFGDWYENARQRPSDNGVCRCTVMALGADTITVADVDATSTVILTIIPPPDFATSSLGVGEVVFVAGTRIASNTIQAYGISAIAPHDMGQ